MSAVYPAFITALATAGVNLSTATIKVIAVDSGYVYDDGHDFLDDVLVGDRLGAAATLAGVTAVDVVEDTVVVGHDWVCTLPFSLTGINAPDVVAGLIFYIEAGSDATRRLIQFQDEGGDGSPIGTAGNGDPIEVDYPDGYWLRLRGA